MESSVSNSETISVLNIRVSNEKIKGFGVEIPTVGDRLRNVTHAVSVSGNFTSGTLRNVVNTADQKLNQFDVHMFHIEKAFLVRQLGVFRENFAEEIGSYPAENLNA